MFSADLGGYTAPLPGATNPPFNKVALLLHGDGTNGAQNNTFVDSSSNNFTITRTGNVAQGTFSPFSLAEGEWSNYFDGTGDYLTTPDNVALQLPTQDFTIECWVYFSALPTSLNATAIFNKGRTGASDFEYQLVAFNNGSNTIIRAGYGTTGPDLTIAVDSGTNYIQTNTWYHVALTRIGTTAKLWINGVNVGTTSSWASTQYSGSGALGIGANNAGGGAITGYLSNVRIVKGTAVYTSNFTPSPTPLTAISGTSLLTCQSNRFKDNSSNNFTITRVGDTKVTAWSPFVPSAAYDASTNGGSGYFDGSGDYLTTAGNSALSGDLTVECFVYLNSWPGGTWNMICGNTTVATDYFGLTTSNVELGIGGSSTYISYPYTFSLNTWYHIAVTRQGTAFKVYVNGIPISASGGSSSASSFLGPMYIGRYSGGLNFNGYISNFRVIDGTAIYTTNFTPPTAPLTAVSGTQLLLNCVNAGIYDNAAKNDIETVGNAQISTSVKKYGTGSMYFDGTGDYLTLAGNSFDFNTGDLTVECWIYKTSYGANETIFSGNRGIAFGFTSGTTNFQLSVPNVSYIQQFSYSFPTNSWYHLAVTKQSNVYRVFVNGNLINTPATYGSTLGNVTPYYVGSYTNTQYFNGYIDDLRVTKGQALYTSNFTPPTQAFPDY